MTSWVYLFSKFTPEALLFEALIIFFLCCGYAVFWVLRKRRYGSVDTTVPSGPIKSYLNELILNSEQIRLQLFGILAGSGNTGANLYKLVGMTGGGGLDSDLNSPDLAKRLPALEAKLHEQMTVVDSLTTVKTKLEKDLIEARSSGGGEGGATLGGREDGGATMRLQQKILELETRLAEYSVIEDDLANLKRLQQENTLLKATLNAKGINPLSAGGPAAEETGNPESPTDEAPPEATPEPPQESTPSAISEPPSEASTESFDGLANQVESSLQESSTETPPSEELESPLPEADSSPPIDGMLEASQNPVEPVLETEATALEPAASAEEAAPLPPNMSDNDKSEADLVAEFERMLKG